jgi:tetratricopeptide (TPR) repeat protein
VFARLRTPGSRRPPSGTAAAVRTSPRGTAWRTAALSLAAILTALAVFAWRGRHSPAREPAAGEEPQVVSQPSLAPPAASLPAPLSAAPSVSPAPTAMGPEDRLLVDDLVRRLEARGSFSELDARSAEALYARYPDEEGVPQLVGAVLLATAMGDASARRLEPALARLQRARALLPGSRDPLLALLQVLTDSGDWAGAEGVARELLALSPGQPDVLERLAFALFRQDRNREAAEVLRELLELRPSASARALLDRIEKTSADERGMTEQQLSHFHVRYDGDAHEDVGREILRVLERHYATLASTLDHQPATAIPVILFSRQQYHDASGAPAWSGGVYEPIDGRIRVPIKGLSAGLTADLERTLIHEVAHAFLADRTKGLCPRDVHEGFAQYMEGKRIADELGPAQVTALADGRIRGVAGFYLQSLSFVEYLLGARGQGGINDLLRAIGESGDVDDAFRRVYGSDQAATHQAWLARLRQQHGSS